MSKEYFIENSKEIIILGVIVLIGGALRIYTLGDRSLWEDEIAQVNYYATAKSIFYVISRAARQFQTPLDYLIGYFLVHLFGVSEFIVRFPAFLFGTLSLLPIYFLTRYIFSVDAAMTAVGITAISKWMIAYSQEARPYSIFIFLLFMSLYFFIRALNENHKMFFILYGISIFFMLLSRGYEPLIAVFVIYMVTLGLYLRGRSNNVLFCSKEFIYRITKVNIISGILYSPFLIILMRPLMDKKYVGSIDDRSYHYWKQVSYLLKYYMNLTFYPLTYFVTLLLIVGIILTISKRNKAPLKIWFVLTAILVTSAQFLIYLKIAKLNIAPFAMRYMIYWQPFIYIIISYAIVSGGKQIGRLLRGRVNYRVISFIISIPILFIFWTNTHAYYHEQKEDWRGSSSYIRTFIKHDDIVWIETTWTYGSYGGYQPVYIGKPIYFPEIRDYSTDALISYVLENVQKKGNVILVYYATKTPVDLNNNNFIVSNFPKIAVITLKEPGIAMFNNILTLLDEMEKLYPNDSSRVRIYLAKARLLFAEEKYNDAYVVIEKARVLVPQQEMKRFNESIVRFFPAWYLEEKGLGRLGLVN